MEPIKVLDLAIEIKFLIADAMLDSPEQQDSEEAGCLNRQCLQPKIRYYIKKSS